MADKSKIEWTDATWNPIRGCSRVSEGCRNCYAERQALRQRHGAYQGLVTAIAVTQDRGGKFPAVLSEPHWTGELRFIEKHLNDPLKWRTPRRIFVNSMSDLFHEKVPIEWIARIFDVMASVTADCGKSHKHEQECWCGDSHRYQVLTKRPERMKEVLEQLPEFFDEHFDGESPCNLALEMNGWPLANVWLGVSLEDQKTADKRIPFLLQTPAVVRFVSYEPALGPVDLRPWLTVTRQRDLMLDWVIAGGESGPAARPAHPDWFRSVRDQCIAAGVPFFFKQWGEWAPAYVLDGWPITQAQCLTGQKKRYEFERGIGGARESFRVGKGKAGRLLDGRKWSQYPEAK